MEISDLQQTIEQISAGELNADSIAEVVMFVANKRAYWKEAEEALEAAMFDHIKATGEPILIGETLYKIGTPKQTKCRNNAEALRTILELGGPEAVEQCLGSNAWKYGTVEKLECMDAMTFARLFEVTYPEKLQEGKPTKKLMKLNTNFIK